jgi:hypothetical protein
MGSIPYWSEIDAWIPATASVDSRRSGTPNDIIIPAYPFYLTQINAVAK